MQLLKEIAQKDSAIVICNGQPLNKLIIDFLAKNARLILATDGAANFAADAGIELDYVIGDFDSISAEQKVKQGKVLVYKPDQNFTDLNKALDFLAEKDQKIIHILSGGAARYDHHFHSLQLLARYQSAKVRVFYWGMSEVIFLLKEGLKEGVDLAGLNGSRISFFPYPEACGISTSGLEFNLSNQNYAFLDASISNKIIANNGKISIESGALLVYVAHQAILGL